MDDEVYIQKPQKMKLSPNYLGPFTVRKVHNNHNYTIMNALGSLKRLHHNQLRLFRANAAQIQTTAVFLEYQHLPINMSANPGEITNTEAGGDPTSSSDLGVTTV